MIEDIEREIEWDLIMEVIAKIAKLRNFTKDEQRKEEYDKITKLLLNLRMT